MKPTDGNMAEYNLDIKRSRVVTASKRVYTLLYGRVSVSPGSQYSVFMRQYAVCCELPV
jgi:hypothetical protein